jgi:hypothetical protein
MGGELLVEIKYGFFKKVNFKVDIKPIMAKNFFFVYVNIKAFKIPKGSFKWIFHNKKFKFEGKEFLTDKFEDLYEGLPN